MNSLAKVIARFRERGTARPVGGPGFEVRLYDHDPVSDDFICSGPVAADGGVELIFDVAESWSVDTPLESKPDLYFCLLYQGKLVHRSRVFADCDFLKADPVSGEATHRTQDLGEIMVELPVEGR